MLRDGSRTLPEPMPSKGVSLDRFARCPRLPRGVSLAPIALPDQEETPMAVERMLTEAEPAAELVGRVLHEAGIEYVFGISGGHTGRIVSGLRKYQNSVKM